MSYISKLRRHIGHDPIIMIGATVMVFNENNEVLFQLRSDTNDWGLPGGSMEIGESTEEAARRELYEETGLTAGKLKLTGVFSGPNYFYIYPNEDQTDTVIVLYETHDASGTLTMTDGESLQLSYFPLHSLPQPMESRTKALFEELKRQHQFE